MADASFKLVEGYILSADVEVKDQDQGEVGADDENPPKDDETVPPVVDEKEEEEGEIAVVNNGCEKIGNSIMYTSQQNRALQRSIRQLLPTRPFVSLATTQF